VAAGSAFVLLGTLFGAWATFIPFVKNKFSIDDAQLGTLLFFFPIGAAIFNPFSAWVIKKMGMKNATTMGMILVCITYLLPLVMNSLLLTSIGLCITGMSIAQLNVAMNTCVSCIEKNDKIHIMSSSHGMFSIGLMIGSVSASISFGAGVSPILHMICLSTLGVILAMYTRPIISSIYENTFNETVENENGKILSSEVKFNIFMMIVVSVCSNITEGTMADWTAVYMKDVVNTSDYFIGWGLSGYSFFMAAGRFLGDGVVPKFGPKKVLFFGSLLAGFGLLIVILLPFTIISIIGFSLVGFGVSFSSPILYGSSARIPGFSAGKGLAILNSLGMIGFLTGPVLIGYISRASNLQIAFASLLVLIVIWGTMAKKVRLY
jgi:MFS family permease